MAWQLIYTSAERGLVPGRSGFCTVARHREIPDQVAAEVERFCRYDRSGSSQISASSGLPVIYSFRTIQGGRSSQFHVLSRLSDSGSDYTGRTNFIAQHLVAEASEAGAISPAEILIQMNWMDAWTEKSPRFLGAEEEIDLQRFKKTLSLPARHWKASARDAGCAALPLESGGKPTTVVYRAGRDHELLLRLTGETLLLLDPKGDAPQELWQIPFTTCLQSSERAGDFKLRGCWEKSACHHAALKSGSQIIDLTGTVTAPSGPLADFARSGVPPASAIDTSQSPGKSSGGIPLPTAIEAGGAPAAPSDSSDPLLDALIREADSQHGNVVKPKSKGPMLILGASLVVLALALAIWFFAGGNSDEPDPNQSTKHLAQAKGHLAKLQGLREAGNFKEAAKIAETIPEKEFEFEPLTEEIAKVHLAASLAKVLTADDPKSTWAELKKKKGVELDRWHADKGIGYQSEVIGQQIEFEADLNRIANLPKPKKSELEEVRGKLDFLDVPKSVKERYTRKLAGLEEKLAGNDTPPPPIGPEGHGSGTGGEVKPPSHPEADPASLTPPYFSIPTYIAVINSKKASIKNIPTLEGDLKIVRDFNPAAANAPTHPVELDTGKIYFDGSTVLFSLEGGNTIKTEDTSNLGKLCLIRNSDDFQILVVRELPDSPLFVVPADKIWVKSDTGGEFKLGSDALKLFEGLRLGGIDNADVIPSVDLPAKAEKITWQSGSDSKLPGDQIRWSFAEEIAQIDEQIKGEETLIENATNGLAKISPIVPAFENFKGTFGHAANKLKPGLQVRVLKKGKKDEWELRPFHFPGDLANFDNFLGKVSDVDKEGKHRGDLFLSYVEKLLNNLRQSGEAQPVGLDEIKERIEDVEVTLSREAGTHPTFDLPHAEQLLVKKFEGLNPKAPGAEQFIKSWDSLFTKESILAAKDYLQWKGKGNPTAIQKGFAEQKKAHEGTVKKLVSQRDRLKGIEITRTSKFELKLDTAPGQETPKIILIQSAPQAAAPK